MLTTMPAVRIALNECDLAHNELVELKLEHDLILQLAPEGGLAGFCKVLSHGGGLPAGTAYNRTDPGNIVYGAVVCLLAATVGG